MSVLSRNKTVTLVVILVLIWGASWPIYKHALTYTPPILFAGMRTLIGGLLLAIVLLPKLKLLQWKQNWPVYLISTVFNVAIFYGAQTVGLNHLPSGLFSVLVYIQPVLVGILAWLWLGESISVLKVIGLLLGFLGVAVVSLGGFSGSVSGIGILLALVTAVSWAIGTIYSKKVSHRVDTMWLISISCIIGGIVLIACSSMFHERWSGITWNLPYLNGLLFGVILGVPISYVIYMVLVNSGDAIKVASYTFMTPLISVFTGTLFLGEPLTLSLFIGLLFIVMSIYLVNHKMKKRSSRLL
jgi:drug/metabolite transporter (DMT)-like permease